jgi:hypothetical protein
MSVRGPGHPNAGDVHYSILFVGRARALRALFGNHVLRHEKSLDTVLIARQ